MTVGHVVQCNDNIVGWYASYCLDIGDSFFGRSCTATGGEPDVAALRTTLALTCFSLKSQ